MSKTHHSLAAVAARDGHLLVNGRRLADVVAAAGGTPVYVYDRARVAARVAELRAALPARVALHYAIKANPMPALVCALAGLVDGFDVASQRELVIALDSGVEPACISFAGPGKSDEELTAAVAAGVVVAVESPRELQRLAAAAAALGCSARAVLRLNPDFQLKRAGLAMTGVASQFGIDTAQAVALLRAGVPAQVDLCGLQVFSGSQNLVAETLIECQQATLELALELAPLLPGGLRYLNLGGGFGIPYFEGEGPLDLARVAGALDALLARHTAALEGTELVLELGRYLVGEAGYYVTRVVDLKTSRERQYAVVDGGMHHHLANSGNLGQVLRRNYPVLVGNKVGAAAGSRVTVTGPLCTPLDMVADDVALPPLEIGDLVVVLQSGAYGNSASPHGFLSRPPPREILV
ncbi:MAG: pyridoxal-dependent decarboxylase, exosortase A system-associated [Gammaproteobacteria bacterium]